MLTYIKPHEQGRLATIANKKGTTFLLEFSEALTANQKNDKLLFTAVSSINIIMSNYIFSSHSYN